jgi:uncharacterized protein YceH (UPF0502 family)
MKWLNGARISVASHGASTLAELVSYRKVGPYITKVTRENTHRQNRKMNFINGSFSICSI